MTSKIVVSRAKPLGHRHFIHDFKPSWGLKIPSYYEYPPRVSLLLHDLVQFKYHPSGCHNRDTLAQAAGASTKGTFTPTTWIRGPAQQRGRPQSSRPP